MQCFEVVHRVTSYWVAPSQDSLRSELHADSAVRSLSTEEAGAVLLPVEDDLRVSLNELAALYSETTMIAIATV